MANQFSGRLLWRRREVWTIDETTGAFAGIRDMVDGSEKPFRWWISVTGCAAQEGRSKTEQAARAAVRARIGKLPTKEPHA